MPPAVESEAQPQNVLSDMMNDQQEAHHHDVEQPKTLNPYNDGGGNDRKGDMRLGFSSLEMLSALRLEAVCVVS